MTKIKSAEQWIKDGVPLPSGNPEIDVPRYVRWVAEIQEDAVKCYETTEAITLVEEGFNELESELKDMPEVPPSTRDCCATLGHRIDDLKKLKMDF